MKRILILGGGTGGTLAANLLARKLKPSEAQIAVVSASLRHMYQPGWLYVPFGRQDPRKLSRPERKPSPPPESATLRSQDFSTNPGWEGLNNRRLGTCVTTRQDFGWRKAGGRDALGGVITRAARPASFGMPVRAFGFGRAFTATGELTVRGTASDPFPSGSAIIGFFNDASRDWRPPNLLAFQSFLTDQLTALPNVSNVKTSLVIRSAKAQPGVPFEMSDHVAAENV